jgi:hypothetical protein
VKVNDEVISQSVLDTAMRLVKHTVFTAGQLEKQLLALGVNNAYRAADRLLQQQRKLGNIRRIGNVWIWRS